LTARLKKLAQPVKVTFDEGVEQLAFPDGYTEAARYLWSELAHWFNLANLRVSPLILSGEQFAIYAQQVQRILETHSNPTGSLEFMDRSLQLVRTAPVPPPES